MPADVVLNLGDRLLLAIDRRHPFHRSGARHAPDCLGQRELALGTDLPLEFRIRLARALRFFVAHMGYSVRITLNMVTQLKRSAVNGFPSNSTSIIVR